MALKINKDHLEMIKALGEESFPNECCGFLLGKMDAEGQKVIASTIPATNERESEEQYHRFLITPSAYLKAERYARENKLEILGFFHSHPNAQAKPSEYDREHAWPWYSYMIVSVKEGKAEDVTSWTMNDDRSRFSEEEILISK
jgi:proteasome lid subunit RPN8/RPN11